MKLEKKSKMTKTFKNYCINGNRQVRFEFGFKKRKQIFRKKLSILCVQQLSNKRKKRFRKPKRLLPNLKRLQIN